MRGLIASLLCVGMLGVVGCQQDNETEADKLAKTAGDPGAPDPKSVSNVAKEPPPSSQEELGKRQMQRQNEMYKKGSGYPGAR
jgi:hypothetical protein